jgi:hypothetical protein
MKRSLLSVLSAGLAAGVIVSAAASACRGAGCRYRPCVCKGRRTRRPLGMSR